MREAWKAIDGFPYEVSDRGRVRRSVGGRGAQCHHVLSQTPNAKGYLREFLYRENRQHTRYVHQLVAAAFIGAKPLGWTVNHRDGVKRRNNPSNLEYATYSENNRHAYATGLKRTQPYRGASGRFTRKGEA